MLCWQLCAGCLLLWVWGTGCNPTAGAQLPAVLVPAGWALGLGVEQMHGEVVPTWEASSEVVVAVLEKTAATAPSGHMFLGQVCAVLKTTVWLHAAPRKAVEIGLIDFVLWLLSLVGRTRIWDGDGEEPHPGMGRVRVLVLMTSVLRLVCTAVRFFKLQAVWRQHVYSKRSKIAFFNYESY